MDPLVNGQNRTSARRPGATRININQNTYRSGVGTTGTMNGANSMRMRPAGMSRGQSATSRVREIPLTSDEDLLNEATIGQPPMTNANTKNAKQRTKNTGYKVMKCVMIFFIAVVLLIIGAAGGVFFDRKVLLKGGSDTDDTSADDSETATAAGALTPEQEIELSEKISYLNLSEDTSEFIVADYYRIFGKLATNSLSESEKLFIAVLSLKDQYQNLPEPVENYTESVPADLVNERYHSLFGADLVQAESPADLCPGYRFDETANLYYVGSGCGGSSLDSDLIYKEKYELDGDTAYAYLRVGSRNSAPEAGEQAIYNDYFASPDKAVYQTIADFSDENEFMNFQINSGNEQSFSEYRVSFQKNDKNEFSLVSVEKL